MTRAAVSISLGFPRSLLRLLVPALVVGLVPTSAAQARPRAQVSTPRPLALRIPAPDRPPRGLGLENGALIIHGNYCGPGDRGWGRAPTDALDAACLRHDICAPPFGTALPSCVCNAQLSLEADAVARSLATPPVTRVTAAFVAHTATLLACRP